MASKERNAVQLVFTDRGVIKALNRSAKGVRTSARAAMEAAGELLRDDMKARITRHGKLDTKRYRDSLTYVITGRRGQLQLEVGPPDEYQVLGGTLEFGRTPGKPMPPKGALLPWMGRHGIPEEAEFPIRRKIGEMGMKDQPFPHIAIAFDSNMNAVDAIFDRVADAVVDAYNSA